MHNQHPADFHIDQQNGTSIMSLPLISSLSYRLVFLDAHSHLAALPYFDVGFCKREQCTTLKETYFYTCTSVTA